MRQLTENEQRIVEKIVQLKQSARLEDYRLQDYYVKNWNVLL